MNYVVSFKFNPNIYSNIFSSSVSFRFSFINVYLLLSIRPYDIWLNGITKSLTFKVNSSFVWDSDGTDFILHGFYDILSISLAVVLNVTFRIAHLNSLLSGSVILSSWINVDKPFLI